MGKQSIAIQKRSSQYSFTQRVVNSLKQRAATVAKVRRGNGKTVHSYIRRPLYSPTQDEMMK